MESCGAICPFAVFACQMWWKLLFQTIDHWILCWLCWWARCWMLQGMDYLEVSCVFLVKVGTLDQLEQNKICILTITLLGIAILTMQHALIFRVCFMKHPGDDFRQISRDVFSVNECPFICINHEISAAMHLEISWWTHRQHRTAILQITGQLSTAAMCGYTQHGSVWVDCASWLLLIPIWLEADYIFLRTSQFLSLSSFSSSQRRQIVAPLTPAQGASGSESSRMTGASSIAPPTVTQPECRHQLVHCDAANAATENMTQSAHLKMVPKTGSSKNKKQHAIRCE